MCAIMINDTDEMVTKADLKNAILELKSELLYIKLCALIVIIPIILNLLLSSHH